MSQTRRSGTPGIKGSGKPHQRKKHLDQLQYPVKVKGAVVEWGASFPSPFSPR